MFPSYLVTLLLHFLSFFLNFSLSLRWSAKTNGPCPVEHILFCFVQYIMPINQQHMCKPPQSLPAQFEVCQVWSTLRWWILILRTTGICGCCRDDLLKTKRVASGGVSIRTGSNSICALTTGSCRGADVTVGVHGSAWLDGPLKPMLTHQAGECLAPEGFIHQSKRTFYPEKRWNNLRDNLLRGSTVRIINCILRSCFFQAKYLSLLVVVLFVKSDKNNKKKHSN